MHDRHTNAFAMLNGIPYLMGEYVDREMIRNVDRSMIYTDVNVDTTEALRAIVDISIDDIGKRASDGRPNVIGNFRKQEDVVNAIRNIYRCAPKSLPVLRSGLVVRVNYQIENQRTGQVMRSIYEDIRIPQREYYLCQNMMDVDDIAYVTNFNSTQVSTINQFTHGIDPMVLRITSAQLCYELIKPNNLIPRRIDRPLQRMEDLTCPRRYEDTYRVYEYHKDMQNHQFLGEPLYGEPDEVIHPREWFAYNRLYHFDNDCSDIILHLDDIYDRHTDTILIQCGSLAINRAFVIQPGHRIIFKMSVWKNDVALFSDTRPVADALDYYPEPPAPPAPPEPRPVPVPYPWYPPYYPPYYPEPHHHHHKGVIDYEQTEHINELSERVNELIQAIKSLKPDTDIDPVDPMPEPHPHPHPFPPHPGKDKLRKILKKMQDEIRELQEHECDCPEMIPLTDEEIQEILDEIPDDEDINIDELSEQNPAIARILNSLDD